MHASTSLSENYVQLKGSLVPMTVMELFQFDSAKIESSLAQIISQAPGFFEDAPIIIALEKVADEDIVIDFAKLLESCAALRIKPVAVRGGTLIQQLAAKKSGLAVVPSNKGRQDPKTVPIEPFANESTTQEVPATKPVLEEVSSPQESPDIAPKAEPEQMEESPQETEMVTTKIIYQPVRSGQQVYARGGDLIILAAVSPGAEILADGNIHVYGPLRGRALAGVRGNTEARIFCQSLEAELVSIAGQYKISEDLQKSGWKSSSQVCLIDDKLTITPLSK